METLQATTLANGQTILDEDTVQAFTERLHGPLLRPGDAGYDEARQVWNGMIDKHPALVAQCADTADVTAAVDFARAHDLLVAVRGGGHNVAGTAVCEGGLVIDLSAMNGVHVDPEACTARAGGGATWADVDRATQAHGLATPGGVVSDTGIAGLTLGGGIGWLRRKWGLSCDNLTSVEIVTADGQLRRASETGNPELFWAIRGGGGNFGVVTSFTYRLHEVGPEVMFVFVFYPGEQMTEALRFYRTYCASAPDEVSSFAIGGTIPNEEPFPAAIHGQPFVLLAACYAGPVEEGERVMQPLREVGEPLVDFSGPMTYVDVQTILDEDYPAGALHYYWKSLYLHTLDDAVIDRLAEHTARRPSPLSTVDVWQLGGAMARIGGEETAFGDRSAPYLLGIEANWEDPQQDEANIAWARAVFADMRRFSDDSQYLNFPGFYEEGQQGLETTYGPNYDRLVEVKNRYDPANLFRLNQNIEPAR